MEKKSKDGTQLSTTTHTMKRMKGDERYEGAKFKLEGSFRKRDDGWQKYKHTFVDEIHGHTYYTINDRNGAPNKYSAPMGGHFHEMEVDWNTPNKTGDGPTVKCGPPLEFVRVKTRGGGSQKKVVQVRWNTEIDGEYIYDNHTHDVTYKYNEIVSPTEQRRQADEDRAKIAHLTKGAVPRMTTTPTGSTGTGAQIEDVSA